MLREEKATKGEVVVNGYNLSKIKEKDVPYMRRTLGVVFQDFRLIPNLTAYENIAFAMRVTNIDEKEIKKRVPYILNLVGLAKKADMYPSQLSGGEQQRVALARALVHNPDLVIADEPTGNLDPVTAMEIMSLLEKINVRGTTILMVTHAKDIVDKMKPKFIEGGQRNGHDPQVLEKIWGDWEKFASYAFNKSHAVCYAWVAYQTAWLKAHYPAEYMSAVLSRSLNNVTELAKQMDECRSMGLSVKGPDINLSRQRYSVDAEGAVRFGLAGIKGFGEGAADAVVNERKKNGPYKDIFDLVERVDMGSVNRKALESLALSGALDSLGKYSREQYMSVNSQGISFLDQVVKYGQKFKADKESNEMSLFGDMEDCEIQIQHPEPPKEVETWSTLERLNKEKELVGLFLSAHPLDEYKFQLLYACNTTMAELESVPNPRGKDEQETILRDLETKPDELERISKLQSREITCGGIVTGWREGTSKAGNPYGILTLEDYSGKHDFVLFGAAYPQWRGFGKEGMYLFIQAKYQPKRFVREVRSIFDVEFSIGTIKQLNQVSDNLLTDLTVMLNCHQLSKAGIHQMADAIIRRVLEDESHRQTEAKTSLYFELCDPIKNYVVKLYSRTCRVHITTGLIEFLRSLDGVMCRINNRLVEDQNTQAEEEEAVIDESELLSED